MTSSLASSVATAGPPTPAAFRLAMSLWPTGVAVLTGLDEAHRPVGMVVGSCFSVSLEPMLIGFCLQKLSSTWATLRATGRFALSFLSADQSELCWRFASGDPARRFDGLVHGCSPSGQPVLPQCCAWLEATLFQEIEAGDHWLALCRVEHLQADPASLPLAFARGRLNRLEPCRAVGPDHFERWEQALSDLHFGS